MRDRFGTSFFKTTTHLIHFIPQYMSLNISSTCPFPLPIPVTFAFATDIYLGHHFVSAILWSRNERYCEGCAQIHAC